MSFNSLILEERLSQWQLARERLLRRTGSQEEIPDASDFVTVEEIELLPPETYAKFCHSEHTLSTGFGMLFNIT